MTNRILEGGSTTRILEGGSTVRTLEGDAGVALVKIANETLNLNEAILRILGLTRLSNETENINEQINRKSALTRIANEIENVSEQISRLLGLRRITNETQNISESTTRRMGMSRVSNENANIDENINRKSLLTRVKNESQEVVEGIIRRLGILRSINETEEISESSIKIPGLIKRVNETLEISEQNNRKSILTRIKNESQEIAEAVAKSMSMVRIKNEVADIVESVIKSLGLVRFAGDNLLVFQGLDTQTNQQFNSNSITVPRVAKTLKAYSQLKKVEIRSGGSAGVGKCAIYRDSDGVLLAVSDEQSMTAGKLFFNFIPPYTPTVDTDIKIGFNVSITTTFGCHPAGIETDRQNSVTYPSFSDPFAPTANQNPAPYVIAHINNEGGLSISEIINKAMSLVRIKNESHEVAEQSNRKLSLNRIINETETVIDTPLDVRPNPNDDSGVGISHDKTHYIRITGQKPNAKIEEILIKYATRKNSATCLVGIYSDVSNLPSALLYGSAQFNPTLQPPTGTGQGSVRLKIIGDVRVPSNGNFWIAHYDQLDDTNSMRNDSTNPSNALSRRDTNVNGDISSLPATAPSTSSVSSNDFNWGVAIRMAIPVLSMTRVKTESQEIVENITKKGVLVRIKNEIQNIQESILEHMNIVRIKSETININEQASIRKKIAIMINETVEHLENLIRIIGLVKRINETVETPENITKRGRLVRITNEVLNIVEQKIIARSLVRIMNEIENITEFVLNPRRMTRTISETENIQENVTVYQFILRFILEFKSRIVRNPAWISRIRRTIDFKTRRRTDR